MVTDDGVYCSMCELAAVTPKQAGAVVETELRIIRHNTGIELHDATGRIMGALTAAGYAIVPVEPTEAMLEAAHTELAGDDGDVSDVYRAMVNEAGKGR